MAFNEEHGNHAAIPNTLRLFDPKRALSRRHAIRVDRGSFEITLAKDFVVLALKAAGLDPDKADSYEKFCSTHITEQLFTSQSDILILRIVPRNAKEMDAETPEGQDKTRR